MVSAHYPSRVRVGPHNFTQYTPYTQLPLYSPFLKLLFLVSTRTYADRPIKTGISCPKNLVLRGRYADIFIATRTKQLISTLCLLRAEGCRERVAELGRREKRMAEEAGQRSDRSAGAKVWEEANLTEMKSRASKRALSHRSRLRGSRLKRAHQAIGPTGLLVSTRLSSEGAMPGRHCCGRPPFCLSPREKVNHSTICRAADCNNR